VQEVLTPGPNNARKRDGIPEAVIREKELVAVMEPWGPMNLGPFSDDFFRGR
jgi:hypothetical protein